MNATVLTGRNNIFDVLADGEPYQCRLKGKTLRLEERAYNPLAPGDEVALSSVDERSRTAVIADRLPRRNAFERYNRKREALQTLAANVDLVVVVMSALHPGFRARFVDRVLVLAAFHEIPAALIVTKRDLAGERAERERERYAALGYRAIAVSSARPESLEAAREIVHGRRAVLLGQSGVGKSTLLNALAGSDLQRTANVSDRFLRGRHTTNVASLVILPDTQIVDTPGVRELDCRHVPREELAWCFPEFRPHLGGCGMTDCLHAEEPGCAIRARAASGALDAERYESYLRLSDELGGLQGDNR